MGQSTNYPLNYIALGLQAARQTEATSFYFLRHLDGSILDPDPDIQREREGGDGQRVGLSYRARVSGDPKLNANSRPEWAGRAVAGILGADASVGSIAVGVYKHLILPTSSARYWTVDERSVNENDRSVDCKFTQVSINWEAGRPIRIDAELISGGTYYGKPIASALTPTRETARPHFYTGASIGLLGASVAMDVDPRSLHDHARHRRRHPDQRAQPRRRRRAELRHPARLHDQVRERAALAPGPPGRRHAGADRATDDRLQPVRDLRRRLAHDAHQRARDGGSRDAAQQARSRRQDDVLRPWPLPTSATRPYAVFAEIRTGATEILS